MENNNEPKVLVGCLVHEGQDFCIDPFWKALQDQEYKNIETVFTTYSDEESLHKKLEKTKSKVLTEKKSEHKIQSIINCRKSLQNQFMESDCEYLLFIEADITLPKNAISRLVFHQKELISGVHLTNMNLGDKSEISPSLFDFAEEGSLRVMELREVIDDKILEIFGSSLGCTLASKKVIEKQTSDFLKAQ